MQSCEKSFAVVVRPLQCAVSMSCLQSSLPVLHFFAKTCFQTGRLQVRLAAVDISTLAKTESSVCTCLNQLCLLRNHDVAILRHGPETQTNLITTACISSWVQGWESTAIARCSTAASSRQASACKQVVTHLRMRSAQALTAGRLSIKLLAPAAGRRAR